MGLKAKITNYYTNSYMKKYGDRITQAQGKVISVKIEEKPILWIFHKLTVTILIKPERSKNIIKCVYRKNKWFKKPEFIPVAQGHSIVVQGLKGLKTKGHGESIDVMNVINMTNRKQLVPLEDDVIKKIQQGQKIKYR
ncbi:hypothetical protein CLHOM_05760 [Clostridium homopropionicum DSM 5847]|uniref:Uncharacterized protein n=1 Tax=Clostridium homopropionicum DSM 5847 TaxID=1121318 RepID=A0A0L6ZDW4_9CLOT|nr:hypothetical protein [Clostridium homopropionicum]KOA20988.1 hypothetical protein CLHOM_05760 [Clostridium homopropionicum DSM 5847]SFG00177.1 hypothetical protein SAMN04488501_104144 [Clostridium homopropionicum]